MGIGRLQFRSIFRSRAGRGFIPSTTRFIPLTKVFIHTKYTRFPLSP